MKIIRIAKKERCPHCGYMNEFDLVHKEDGKMNCDSCDGYWDAFSSNTEPRAFDEAPVAVGYSNPRSKANYTPYTP